MLRYFQANEEGLALLRQLETMTTAGAVIRMARKDVSQYLDPPLDEILTMPEVQHVVDSIKLGATTPTPPVLIVQAVHDYPAQVVAELQRNAASHTGPGRKRA